MKNLKKRVPQIILFIAGILAISITEDQTSIIFLGVMFLVIYTIRKLCFKNIKEINRDIKNMTCKIENFVKEGDDVWEKLRNEKLEFTYPALNNAFKNYKKEMDRLFDKNKQVTTCDIEEYINLDLIDREIKKNICDQIPGILTGLGILGTFWGLTMGLQNFDFENIDTMTESIQALMDGIKVAFSTSISGVALSLAYTIYYKSKLGEIENVLTEFLEIFSKEVVHNSEHERYKELVATSKSQSESMAQFAETISLELAKSLNQVVAPTMNKLTDAIDQITENATKNQEMGMEKIADSFVNQLGQLMGNQFQNLGNTIEQLCTWQESTMIELKNIIDVVSNTAHDIKEVNEYSKDIIVNLEGYTNRLNILQEEINLVVERIIHENEKISLQNQEQGEFVKLLIEEEKTIKATIDSMNDNQMIYIATIDDSLQSYNKMLNNCGETMVQVNKFIENESNQLEKSAVALSNQFDNVNQRMEEQKEKFEADLDSVLERTFNNFDHNLSEICRHLSGTISSVEKTTDRVPTIINMSYEGMETNLNRHLQAMESICNKIEKKLEEENV